jgi:rfaE bifunctional protein kinase chain/domain
VAIVKNLYTFAVSMKSSFTNNITHSTGKNILVIGDIMLDHYIYGNCNRISPEAPVPVVEVANETYTLGGAGNVIKNLKALNCGADIVSICGEDVDKSIVLNNLRDLGVNTDYIIGDDARCTTVKTRVVAVNHQLIRLDRESTKAISAEVQDKIISVFSEIVSSYDMVLISDYNKGLLTAPLLAKLFDICKSAGIATIVDPKGTDFSKYKGVQIIKPNKKEASIASGINIIDGNTLELACKRIKEITQCESIIVTMSEEGIALYEKDSLHIIPTKAIGVVDVTGAGDTVLASLGISLADSNNLTDACEFANYAAAVVVKKLGSATATLDEIKQISTINS